MGVHRGLTSPPPSPKREGRTDPLFFVRFESDTATVGRRRNTAYESNRTRDGKDTATVGHPSYTMGSRTIHRKPKKAESNRSVFFGEDTATEGHTTERHTVRVESVENWEGDTWSVSHPILCVGAVITGSPKKPSRTVAVKKKIAQNAKKACESRKNER